MSERVKLAITMGDPAGIGPEVVVKALSVRGVRAGVRAVVFGDAGALGQAMRLSELGGRIVELAPGEEPPVDDAADPAFTVYVRPVSCLTQLRFGSPSAEGDQAQLQYVRAAFEDVMAGRLDAIVTAPISKASIVRAGASHPGHTELLADWVAARTGTSPAPVMMLAGDRLKVVPLTTHVALAEVPKHVTKAALLHVIEVVHSSFRTFFGLARPHIALAGLNPHAGEGGLFGEEDAREIAPAVRAAEAAGIAASGPWPADAVFRRAAEGDFDVVIGMYHDQALIPVKLLDFDSAVNVTLGLPLVRTSVDHGTAFDLAGRGVASSGSMQAAIRLAERMVRARKKAAPA